MTTKQCEYQKQDSLLTLEEGIAEYYRANPHLLLPVSTDPAAQFFLCHDRIHVIFGCDTSLLHEVRTDLWTILGSDIGFVKYLQYVQSSAIQLLYKDLKEKASQDPEFRKKMRSDIKRAIRPAFLSPFKVLMRARKMKKKWPWFESEKLMNRSLKELREDYGIRVFQ